MKTTTPRGLPSRGPEFARFVAIAHEHVLIWVRNPRMVDTVAKRLRVTHEAALALAIADQVFDEFTLRFNRET